MDSKPPPSSSSLPSLRKVCVVCYCCYEGHHEFNIHIIDLMSEESIVLALDEGCIYAPAFCLFGSTLYIFEGYNSLSNPDGGKSVLRFDLPEEKSKKLKLEKSMLIHDSYLNDFKFAPRATVTPSGRILVFSSCIELYDLRYDFELYDPINQMWHKLPIFRPTVPPDCDYFWIHSSTFFDDSVLFLETEFGFFSMDLKPPHRKPWKMSGFCVAPRLPPHLGNSLAVIGKDMCLIPCNAFDIDGSGLQKGEDVFSRWYFSFPDFEPFPDHLCNSAGIVVVNDDDSVLDDCNFCILQVGVDDERKGYELIFDVFNCHLNECRKRLSEIRKQKIKEDDLWWKRKREGFLLPGTVKIKSFKISLKHDRFGLCSISSIPYL